MVGTQPRYRLWCPPRGPCCPSLISPAGGFAEGPPCTLFMDSDHLTADEFHWQRSSGRTLAPLFSAYQGSTTNFSGGKEAIVLSMSSHQCDSSNRILPLGYLPSLRFDSSTAYIRAVLLRSAPR